MKGFIFDLDGTIYLGDQLIEGADETIRQLRARGDKIVFLSNKPIATRESYVEKLNKMGIPCTLEEVINSSLITARYLKRTVQAGEKVLVIGEEPLLAELRDHQIVLTDDWQEARYVVLSWDRQLTYDKINDVFQAAIRGAVLLATNPDRTCPLEDGQVPDTGSLIGAIEGATGEKIQLITGKPSKIAAEEAVRLLDLDYADCYMVGDRLETDIKMGNETGMNSVLVLTGISTAEMARESVYQPRYVLDSVKGLLQL